MLTLYAKILKVALRQAKRISSICVESPTIYSLQTIQHVYQNRSDSAASNVSTTHNKNKKDFKAIRTLGIVMVAFFCCWFPFFLIYLVHPFKPDFILNANFSKVSIWLGYCNSAINPFLYTSRKDFRQCIRKCFDRHNQNYWSMSFLRKFCLTLHETRFCHSMPIVSSVLRCDT